MPTDILLESGTNELEVLEFEVDGNAYGINVAKINEILPYQKPTFVPNVHPCIEGIFMPRDQIVSIINLARYLHLEEQEETAADKYMILHFNKIDIGVHVHNVIGIHRVSWQDICKPDETINSQQSSVATGILKLEDRLLILLDFEKILADINPETGLRVSSVSHFTGEIRSKKPIMVVEDSVLLCKLIIESLHKAGYLNVCYRMNGQEAWDQLQTYKQAGSLEQFVACVITDIEMPQMDGHHLLKSMKEDEQLRQIPVVLFSSLITPEMYRKGKALGANAQLSKPDIGKLIEILDGLVGTKTE